MENCKKRWYSIALLIAILLCFSSVPFHYFIKSQLVINVLNIVLKLLFIALYIYYINKEKLHKLNFSPIKKSTLLFLPFLIVPFSNFIVVIFNDSSLNENISTINIIIEFLLCLLIAISEEIVFRGNLFKEFLKHKSPFLSILYSSLIFGAIHLLNISSLDSIIYCLIQAIYAFAIGLIMAFMYYYTDNIIIPISFHFLYNFINDSLITNLYDLKWDISFYIINIAIALITIIYGLFLFKKLIKKG